MPSRRIPVKLVAIGLAVLPLLAWLPVPDAVRNVMLMGWVLAFYAALAQWAHMEEVRAFRETVRPVTQPLPEGFFDADRVAMQGDFHVWDQDVNTNPQECLI